jgi:gamma-glutamylcyclotransferase (GGCT)/AIG2-like uncharacterized protein YtfP
MTKSDTGSELVFVCGPLRQEGSHASLMDVRAELVGPATVEGSLYAIAWFPGFLPEKGKGLVAGELYRVTPDLLNELDEFESKASGEVEGAGCRRVKVEAKMLTLSGDKFLEAWAWEWSGPVEDRLRIGTGDWLDFSDPRGFPWFTWIAFACVIAWPAGAIVGEVLSHSRGSVARIAGLAMGGAALCAPFAALWAIWIGMRAREKGGPLGCAVVLAILGAMSSAVALFNWFARFVG